MPEIAATVDVAVPAERAWEVLTDWAGQRRWVLATRVTPVPGGLVAVTAGVVRDPMEITVWDPPRRCEVRHTGSVVRGHGVFDVSPLSPDRCRITWAEWLPGPAALAAVVPVVRWGLARSLRRLAALLSDGPA
ncbi:MAG TPA: SRPBCC family protein [Mycobacteriales bacterium]|nr:SRPBCC family protein [Mycobacteriales bacterium]